MKNKILKWYMKYCDYMYVFFKNLTKYYMTQYNKTNITLNNIEKSKEEVKWISNLPFNNGNDPNYPKDFSIFKEVVK